MLIDVRQLTLCVKCPWLCVSLHCLSRFNEMWHTVKHQLCTREGVVLLCQTGVTHGEDCGLSVNTVAWIHGDEFGPYNYCHLFIPFAHSAAPSDALAGLCASHGRGRPLLWSQSYNETCEIWTDSALFSYLIPFWHFPLKSRLALLPQITPTGFLYTYPKVLFIYSVLWLLIWTWQPDYLAQTGRNSDQGHLQFDKGS